ncbi:hypothetical protein D3C81_1958130 [compost metagenome]
MTTFSHFLTLIHLSIPVSCGKSRHVKLTLSLSFTFIESISTLNLYPLTLSFFPSSCTPKTINPPLQFESAEINFPIVSSGVTG